MSRLRPVVHDNIDRKEVLGASISSIEFKPLEDSSNASGSDEILIDLSNGHEILIYRDARGHIVVESD